jgi:Zn-dependent protease with chaperone function
MDFFEAQARAKQRTTRLVWMFALAVLGTILASYLVAVSLLRYTPRSYNRGYTYSRFDNLSQWWYPDIFAAVALGALAIILIASLYKWSQMRAGGAAIAESVGGRRLDARTTDLRERQLLNVVEEMAIAAGIPRPAVYVLDDEPGLNAFAAGLTTGDAAVAVTRGTLDKLTRDELQGVIGHEFSHILNGDMRLNVKLTAIVFGILVIGLLGRGLLQSLGRGRIRTGSGKNKGGGLALIIAIGVALMIIGYIGYFFGRLIQAAVSRQREFLADASAVQFTRNPDAITGALKKIGGYALGGQVTHAKAGEIGHFFFAQAFKSNFGGLWATHPPLDERIRAIDPRWDGKVFAPAEVVDVSQESFVTAGFTGGQRYSPDETLERVHSAEPDLPPPLRTTPIPFQPAAVVANIGALTDAHFRHAQALLGTIPTRLREAAREPETAQALVYGLLLSGTREARDRQQALVAQHAGAEAAATLASLRSALSLLDPVARLPLLQLALPALRPLAGVELDRFCTTLDELVHADSRVSPFEYALQKMLLSQLQLAREPARRVQFVSFSGVRTDIAVVLSALAHLSAKDTTTAFAQGAAQLPLLKDQLTLLDAAASGLEQVDAALDRLAVSSLVIRQQVLVAVGHVIASDGTVSVEEGELYRALAATLDVPMPSLGGADPR